jgi:hypothetical protein
MPAKSDDVMTTASRVLIFQEQGSAGCSAIGNGKGAGDA